MILHKYKGITSITMSTGFHLCQFKTVVIVKRSVKIKITLYNFIFFRSEIKLKFQCKILFVLRQNRNKTKTVRA